MEVYEIGYEDYLNSGGVSLIEWADIIESELPDKYIKIVLSYSNDDDIDRARLVDLTYVGDEEKKGDA